jgi:hypothetical protein
MKSLPSVEQVNLEKYWDTVRKLEPEFYLLRITLKETGVNPMILPKIIRAISNLYIGTKYGKVTTYMQNGIITTVEGEERTKVEEQAVLEDD